MVSSLLKSLKKKVKNKTVLKSSKVTLKLKERETPSVLNDPNRFFKEEMEETKKSMFLR